jgi:hypothetical protein
LRIGTPQCRQKNAHFPLRPAARAWAAESNPEKPRGIAAIFVPPAPIPSSDNALPRNRNLPACSPAIATSLPPPTPRPRRPPHPRDLPWSA